MSSNIYTEAITEARKLREIAEQNAKNAIIEAVTPKIREFIDNQLMNNHDSDLDDTASMEDIISESIGINTDSIKSKDSNNDVELDESALRSLASIIGNGGDGADILGVLAESINSLDQNQADLVLSAAKKISTESKSFSKREINNDVTRLQENNTMASREKVYEVDLGLLREEIEKESDGRKGSIKKIGEQDGPDSRDEDDESKSDDLKEMLRDLGLISEDKIQIDLGDDVELPEDIMLTAMLVAEEEGDEEDLEVGEEVMDLEDDGEELEVTDEEELSLDEEFDIDPNVLREELSRVRRLVREAKSLADAKGGVNSMESSWGGKGNAKAGAKNSWGGKGSGKGNAFGGGSEKGDVYKVKINALSETLKKELRKNRALQERLEEYRGAVETLREQLTDLNLFNAKLLYVNKLFQDKSVTPTSRKSMVESIDAAKSLREVKLIYKTLTSSKARSRNLNESKARTLGSSSRAMGRSSATTSSTEVDRWAVLAGIKN